MKAMGRFGKWVLFVVLCTAGATCSVPVRRVEVYVKDGVRFSHYSEWTITEDAPVPEFSNARIIYIEWPHHAVLGIAFLPEEIPMTLERFASFVADKRDSAIEKKLGPRGPIMAPMTRGTSDKTKALIAGQDTVGIRDRFAVLVMNQPLPFQEEFFMIRSGRQKVFLTTHAAEEDLEQARVGWQKVYDTLSFDVVQ